MTQIPVLQFYFYTYMFFIKDILFFNKKDKTPPVTSNTPAQINLLDDEDAVIMQKPSQSEAIMNQAILAISKIPKDTKKKIIISVVLVMYFILSGLICNLYYVAISINNNHTIGWILLCAVLCYFSYRIIVLIYEYFKQKKYNTIFLKLRIRWENAKSKTHKKLNKSSF